MTRIIVADDHAIVREGLVPLIAAQPGLSVVGEADNGLDALRMIERLKPDIAIVDIVMPELGGIDVARQARDLSPDTRVIILSAYSEERYVLAALRAGSRAYVLKEARPRDLITAITEVAAGRRYLSPPLAEAALDAYIAKARPSPEGDPSERLTAREREVLGLTAQGKTAAQVAQLLGINVRTAETHRANLMRKLGVRNRSDLVRYAIEQDESGMASGRTARRRGRHPA